LTNNQKHPVLVKASFLSCTFKKKLTLLQANFEAHWLLQAAGVGH